MLEKLNLPETDDRWVLGEAGYCLNQLDRSEEAIGYLKRSIELKPDHAWTYCQLGISYKNTNQLEAAEASLKKGLELGYADSWPHYQLAIVYNRMEKYEEALKEVPLGFDEDEKDCSDYHWMMARNLGPLGKHREAIAHLRKANDHDEASLYEEFGWNYSELELYDKALDYFQRAAHLREEKSGWLLAQLGCTEDRLGHHPKADVYLKEALEKGYDTPWFHTVLAYHYWKTGKREEALKWLNMAKDEGRHPDWMDQAFKELEKPKGFKLFKGK